MSPRRPPGAQLTRTLLCSIIKNMPYNWTSFQRSSETTRCGPIPQHSGGILQKSQLICSFSPATANPMISIRHRSEKMGQDLEKLPTVSKSLRKRRIKNVPTKGPPLVCTLLAIFMRFLRDVTLSTQLAKSHRVLAKNQCTKYLNFTPFAGERRLRSKFRL